MEMTLYFDIEFPQWTKRRRLFNFLSFDPLKIVMNYSFLVDF